MKQTMSDLLLRHTRNMNNSVAQIHTGRNN